MKVFKYIVYDVNNKIVEKKTVSVENEHSFFQKLFDLYPNTQYTISIYRIEWKDYMNCERCAESIMINGNYVPSNGACTHCIEEKESHKESFNENEETKPNQD